MASNIKGPHIAPSGPIQSPAVPENETVVFSFNYFEPAHAVCNAQSRDGIYFRSLLRRFTDVGRLTVKQFRTIHASRAGRHAVRIHQIDWSRATISVKGFGIPHRQDLDEQAWQFSVDQHENGRVHGFLIGRIFHVVWLDPEHGLYPW